MDQAIVLALTADYWRKWLPQNLAGWFWLLFGLCAQAAFAARFLVQWIASERRRRSYVPVAFWYLSLTGGVMLLAYAALSRHDPVFSLGQAAGCFVYVRNLMLLRREKRRAAREVSGDADNDS